MSEPAARPGWTPSDPQPGGRDRPRRSPFAVLLDRPVGWRAGLLAVVVVVVLAAGVALRSGTAASVTVPPRNSDPSTSGTSAAASGVGTTAPGGSTTGPGGPPSTGAPVSPGTMAGAQTVVVVHVAGAVAGPGVVTLPAGARVQDAVSAAGGAVGDADLNQVNLARVIADGEQIVVPRQGETVPAPQGGQSGAVAPGATAPQQVNLNTADIAELDTLPGIGPVLAQRIVQWRTDNGGFTAVDDLAEVSGVGERLLEQLRPLVRV